jgi:hypothetical protein
MATIEIDFDVFKALTVRRTTEDVSYNDVLRDILALGEPKRSGPTNGSSSGDWVTKGVRFPAGTEFRANYKGEPYQGIVEGGALRLNGKVFDSPSRAAMSITKSAVNGWTFWECRLPEKTSWQLITVFRK